MRIKKSIKIKLINLKLKKYQGFDIMSSFSLKDSYKKKQRVSRASIKNLLGKKILKNNLKNNVFFCFEKTQNVDSSLIIYKKEDFLHFKENRLINSFTTESKSIFKKLYFSVRAPFLIKLLRAKE